MICPFRSQGVLETENNRYRPSITATCECHAYECIFIPSRTRAPAYKPVFMFPLSFVKGFTKYNLYGKTLLTASCIMYLYALKPGIQASQWQYTTFLVSGW